MSDRLVVEKSARQRWIEGVILFVLPPAIALACRFYVGPGLWQIPIILFGLITLSILGNAVAVKTGGALMTPAERYRRTLQRMMSRSVWVSLLQSFAFWLVLNLSMLLPMSSEGGLSLLLVCSFSIFGAAVCSALSVLYRRRVGTRFSDTEHPLTSASPAAWLRAYAPLRLISIATIGAGYLVGRHFAFPVDLIVLLVGATLGSALETWIQSRRIKTVPLLWYDLGFRQALLVALATHGLSFTLYFGFMTALIEQKFDIGAALSALGGGVGGVLLGLSIWGLAKLNMVKSKVAHCVLPAQD